MDVHPGAGQEAAQQFSVALDIIHDQYFQSGHGGMDQAGSAFNIPLEQGVFGDDFDRQAYAEATALVEFTAQADVAPKQRNQVFADGQAEPITFRNCLSGLALFESIKNDLLIFCLHADAGVINTDQQNAVLRFFADEIHLEGNPALVGKFEGIGQQVDADLADGLWIRFYRGRQLLLNIDFE